MNFRVKTCAAAAALAVSAAVCASDSVTVYMPSPTGLNSKYVAAFEEQTGIKVKLFEGTTGQILARLEAEKANPVADVVVLASWSDGLAVKNSGLIQAYPEAKNADRLYPQFIDDDRTLFGTSASAVGVIYNTTIIEKLEADWSELASDKYQGQVAIPDPEKSGSCKDFLAGYSYANGGDMSVFRQMAENGLSVAGANKAALESVLTGENAVLVAGVDYNAYSNIKKGEPLAIYYPASGTVINPRPAMILKTSKELDNAKAFVDFLLSDKAQELVANAFLLPGRSDVTTQKRTNVNEIPQFKVLNWDEMMKNSTALAQDLNRICSKK